MGSGRTDRRDFLKRGAAVAGGLTLGAAAPAIREAAASGESVDVNELRFWEVFGSLKWGVVCLMQTFSHIKKKRRSVELAAIGRRISEVEIDLLNLIYDKGL